MKTEISENIICPKCGKNDYTWAIRIAQHVASCDSRGDFPREINRIICECKKIFYVKTLTCYKISTSQF